MLSLESLLVRAITRLSGMSTTRKFHERAEMENSRLILGDVNDTDRLKVSVNLDNIIL